MPFDLSALVLPKSRGRLSLLLTVAVTASIVYLLSIQLRPGDIRSSNPSSRPPISVSGPESAENQEIPRKIWQTWHTSAILLADEHKSTARTWQEKNPYYRYELITDEGAENYVCQHFADEPLLRDVFLNLTDTILRADFLRYLVLLAEGGVYADLDVVCRESIDTWIPASFLGKPGAVVGIENDRQPVENDVKLYSDHREHIWGITNWTFMSRRRHPFMRLVAETVAKNLFEMAQKQNRSLATLELSYKEVIDSTGPGAFTEILLAYASSVTGTKITYLNATMLEEPKMLGDVLILPVRAMSIPEADREGGGAHSRAWPSIIYHLDMGSWKKTHVKRPDGD